MSYYTFFLTLQVAIIDCSYIVIYFLQLLFLQLMDDGQLDYTHAISLVEYFHLLSTFVTGSCLCLSAIVSAPFSCLSGTTDTEGK